MKKKKLVTFKDYINALKRLQKVAQELEDIDKEMGGLVIWYGRLRSRSR